MTHNPDILLAEGYTPTAFHGQDRDTLCRAARQLHTNLDRLAAFEMTGSGWQVWIKPSPPIMIAPPSFEYKPIPQEVLDKGYRHKVHVKGWDPKFCFFYRGTSRGTHTLATQDGGLYYTNNQLLYTVRYTP